MTTVRDILGVLCEKAPMSYKMDFDNVGLLVGDADWPVLKVLIALDITEEVVTEAQEKKAGLIVSHHPLFFSLKSVSSDDVVGKRIMRMISSEIAGICMHTNLDSAYGGVNDALAERCGLSDTIPLVAEGIDKDGNPYGIGRIGTLPETVPLSRYLPVLKQALNTNGLRYHDAGRAVKKVAVGGGACGDYIKDAVAAGCDTFISSDLKYDVFLDAKLFAINLVDADHYCTENVIVPVLVNWLKESFPGLGVQISESHSQTVRFQ